MAYVMKAGFKITFKYICKFSTFALKTGMKNSRHLLSSDEICTLQISCIKYTGLKDNLCSLGIEIVSSMLTGNNTSVLFCFLGTE